MTTPAASSTQTVVVTGAGSGIGRAIAGTLAQRGWRVIVSDIDMEIEEQITAIAQRMGFESELSAVLDKIGR